MSIDVDRKIAMYSRWIQFHEINHKLTSWMDSRPFIFPGNCEYASALILEMIALCEQIMVYGDANAAEEREVLFWMLDDIPPPTDPLTRVYSFK